MNNEISESTLKFMKSVTENAPSKNRKEWGKSVEFKCPLCNGTVTCVRSTYNGHIFAKCDGCGHMIME